jgi:putative ABC transport system permease protein
LKYLPLIRAALWRRPAEWILMTLAVSIAFALFSLMTGLHATYRGLIEAARADRIYVNQRFGQVDGLPLALRDPLRRFEGVTGVSAGYVVCGYHVRPGDTACVMFADEGIRESFSELPISAETWRSLFQVRDGVLVSRSAAQKWRLRENDIFPLITAPELRADGNPAWYLKVVGIVPDGQALWGGNFIVGNYGYFDSVRPPGRQARVSVYRLAIKDGSRAGDTVRRIDRFFANSGSPTLSISARAAEEALAHTNVDMASLTMTVATACVLMTLFLTGYRMAASVRERLPEFAVLKTLGWSGGRVAALVLAEAAIPCVLGALLGVPVAVALADRAMRLIPKDILYVPRPDVSPAVAVSALGLALLLALVSSTAPILGLRRMDLAAVLARR